MLTNLKQIYLYQRDLVRAIAIINKMLLLYPKNTNELIVFRKAEALRDRGLLYYELNQWQESSQDLEDYLAMLPNADDVPMIKMLLNKIKP